MKKKKQSLKLKAMRPSQISEQLAEKLFTEWIKNNKSIKQIAREYEIDYQQLLRVKERYAWAARRIEIGNKLREKHDKDILKLKSEMFKTTQKLVKVAAKKINDMYKTKNDGVVFNDEGELVLANAFVRNAKDWKAIIESTYLVLNDGVEKKEIKADVVENIVLSSETASQLLKALAEDKEKDEAIDVEFEENDD